MDDGNGRDGIAHRPHAFVELVLSLVRADDGPRGAVVDHLLVGLFGTRRGLEMTLSLILRSSDLVLLSCSSSSNFY